MACRSLHARPGKGALSMYRLPAIAVLAVAGLILPASAGSAGTGSHVTWCRQYGAVREGRYEIRDDFWGGGHVCVTAEVARPGFTVTRTAFPANRNPVYAFPNILYGCEWGVCSRRSGLPARVSSLRGPEVTDRTAGYPHTSGCKSPATWRCGYNAAIETWFSKTPMRSGQPDEAELMIWLRAPGWRDSSQVVDIGGVAYYLAVWRDERAIGDWDYIQFNRVHPVSGVTGLRLAPFIRYAVRHGWIRRRSWLDSIEAGFELRAGGRWLAVTRFAART